MHRDDAQQPPAGRQRGFRTGVGAEHLTAARDALGLAASVDPWDLPADALVSRIEELAAMAATIEALLVGAVSAFDAQELWRLDGAGSAKSWLTFRTGDRSVECHRRVCSAALVHRYPALAEAVQLGAVSTAQVASIARVAVPARRAVLDRDLSVLLEAAVALDADAFDTITRQWASLADDDLDRPPASERRHHENRRLVFVDNTNGTVHIDGVLPAAAAGVVRAALDHLDRPDPLDAPEGPRTAPQRAADNLVEMARRAMLHTDGSANPEATVLVTVAADVLAGNEQLASQLRDGDVRCCFADGRPLPPEAVRRFGCSSWMARVLFSAENEVLALGRKERHFSRAQRNALAARDQGCVWPGCDRPVAWCDAHHLLPWEDEGPTDIDNGAMVCGYHHTLVHEGGWALRHDPDGGWTCFDPYRRPKGSADREHQRREPPPGPIPPRRPTTRRPHRDAQERRNGRARRTGEPPRPRIDTG